VDAFQEKLDTAAWVAAQAWVVAPEQHGQRLDLFLVERQIVPSRSLVQKLIEAGLVAVDQHAIRPSFRLKAGQTVSIQAFEPPREEVIGEDIPLTILYEDEEIAAINKPAGMVVHPAKGHWSGTLTAGLAFRFKELSQVGGLSRPGIVHRLDRDTSGVILVAKTDRAHVGLTRQFERRTVKKRYWALVRPAPDRDADIIEQPIGIHPFQREKMAIRGGHATSRPAVTYFEVRERFAECAIVDVFPRTGRTHQIRVHLAHIGCPILGDRLYSGRAKITRGMLNRAADDEVVLTRQALHATSLEFKHPTTHLPMRLEAPLADDLSRVVAILNQAAAP
jgi:23S rRNA pseudouridine1911/1915/1917 synthase